MFLLYGLSCWIIFVFNIIFCLEITGKSYPVIGLIEMAYLILIPIFLLYRKIKNKKKNYE
jgi:uncharacterized membrane protein YjgN (DUF898 family)